MLAQYSPASGLARRGDRVALNGRTVALPWGQWTENGQTRTGLSDMGLSRRLGVELLDADRADAQPVRWFSGVDRLLPARAVGPDRYLDVTDLARDRGWTLQIDGTTLAIATPPAVLQRVRIGNQPWGRRYVFDLDRATPWEAREIDGAVSVTADADLAAGVAEALAAVSADAQGDRDGQAVLVLPLESGDRWRAFTLTDPDRLVVDMRPDALVERDVLWTPGLHWRQGTVAVGSDRFPAYSLVVDLRQPELTLRPVSPNPDGQTGIAATADTARRWGAIAAINGIFFNRNNQLPLGAMRRDGIWTSGPILNRGALAWTDDGRVVFGRLALQETATVGNGGHVQAIGHLNSGYVQAGMARYTPAWGPSYTPLTDGELGIAVGGDKVLQHLAGGAAGTVDFPIPPDGYLLVARALDGAAADFPVGATVAIASAPLPAAFAPFPHALGGGPLLLLNSQVVLDPALEGFSPSFADQRAPRSAIGQLADGRLILTAVQDRAGGPGPSLVEMAQVMRQLGAVHALNLDGGSSASLYLGGELLNRPPATAARVHGVLGLFWQP